MAKMKASYDTFFDIDKKFKRKLTNKDIGDLINALMLVYRPVALKRGTRTSMGVLQNKDLVEFVIKVGKRG